MSLNLPTLLLRARCVRPPRLDRVLANTVCDKAGPLEVLSKIGKKRRIAKLEFHRPQTVSLAIGVDSLLLEGVSTRAGAAPAEGTPRGERGLIELAIGWHWGNGSPRPRSASAPGSAPATRSGGAAALPQAAAAESGGIALGERHSGSHEAH